MANRVRDIICKIKRQIQSVVELDYFASSMKNDKVIIASLDLLVRGMEQDHRRLLLLEKEVSNLRELLNKSEIMSSQKEAE